MHVNSILIHTYPFSTTEGARTLTQLLLIQLPAATCSSSSTSKRAMTMSTEIVGVAQLHIPWAPRVGVVMINVGLAQARPNLFVYTQVKENRKNTRHLDKNTGTIKERNPGTATVQK